MKLERPWPAWATFAMRVSAGVAILAGCFLLPDMSALPDVASRADPIWLSVALLLAILGTVLLPSLMTFQALGIERINLTLGELVRINFSMRFYVIVLPRAASMGIRWLRYSKGGDAHDALVLIVYERLMQLFVMTLIGTCVLAVELDRLGQAGIIVLVVSISCTAVLGALLLPFIAPAAGRWLAAVIRLSNCITPDYLMARLQRLLDAVTAYHRLHTPVTLKVLIYAVLAYVLFVASPYAVAIGMDTEISLVALAWIRPLVFLMTMLPFTVGGLGVREAGFIGLLHLYGIASPDALIFSLMLFAIQIVIGLVGLVLEISRRATASARASP